jgi:hypothetical protein
MIVLRSANSLEVFSSPKVPALGFSAPESS